jgi:hypothetical protein
MKLELSQKKVGEIMKKIAIVVMVLMVSFFAVPALADWEVTVSGWTMSVGPDLAHEQVLSLGADMCGNILPVDGKTCVFTVANKSNQEIRIRSFDSSGNYADNIVGNIGGGPNPSAGGTIIVIWK